MSILWTLSFTELGKVPGSCKKENIIKRPTNYIDLINGVVIQQRSWQDL